MEICQMGLFEVLFWDLCIEIPMRRHYGSWFVIKSLFISIGWDSVNVNMAVGKIQRVSCDVFHFTTMHRKHQAKHRQTHFRLFSLIQTRDVVWFIFFHDFKKQACFRKNLFSESCSKELTMRSKRAFDIEVMSSRKEIHRIDRNSQGAAIYIHCSP